MNDLNYVGHNSDWWCTNYELSQLGSHPGAVLVCACVCTCTYILINLIVEWNISVKGNSRKRKKQIGNVSI